MKTIFDNILDKKGIDGSRIPLPLWKLKVSHGQFEELKKEIRNCILSERFGGYEKDIVLFYSEWWRRCCDGNPRRDSFLKDLFPENSDVQHQAIWNRIGDNFYSAAKKGANTLGLELIRVEINDQTFRSILYQGGLPLKAIISDTNMNNWRKFLKNFIFQLHDIDLSVLCRGASLSSSIDEFCYVLQNACDKKSYAQMPFFCDSEEDEVFQYLCNEIKEIKNEYAKLHPFTMEWNARFNGHTHEITFFASFNGPKFRKLSDSFLEIYQLNPDDIIYCSYIINNDTEFTASFVDNYSDRDLHFSKKVNVDDEVAIIIADQTIVSDTLSIDVPLMFTVNETGCYDQTSKIGYGANKLIIPEGWIIEGEFKQERYVAGQNVFNVAYIPGGYGNPVRLVSPEGDVITFGRNPTIRKTVVTYGSGCYDPLLEKPIFKLEQARVKLQDSNEEVNPTKVKYRSKGSNEWASKPNVGIVYIKGSDAQNNYYNPVKVVYLGDSFSISCHMKDEDTAWYTIHWEDGNFAIENGRKRNDGIWEVKRKDVNGRFLKCKMTPHGNGAPFHIDLVYPFYEYSILDNHNNPITGDCVIPLEDLSMYKYRFHGTITKDSIEAKLPTYKFRLRYLWNNGCISVLHNGERVMSLNETGSLANLLTGDKNIRNAMDQSADRPIDGKYDVTFFKNDGNINLHIRRNPYEFYVADGIIHVKCGKCIIPYDDTLKFYSFSDYKSIPDAQEIKRDKNGQYLMPSNRPKRERILVFSSMSGRVLPRMLVVGQDITDSQENKKKGKIIRRQLLEDTFNGEAWKEAMFWFEKSQKDQIPASSFFHLKFLASSPQLLIRFVAHKLLDVSGEDEVRQLIKTLIELENSLSFQWMWVKKYLTCGYLDKFLDIDNQVLKNRLIFKKVFKDHPEKIYEIEELENDASFLHNLLNEYKQDVMSFINLLVLLSKDYYKAETAEVTNVSIQNDIREKIDLEISILEGRFNPWDDEVWEGDYDSLREHIKKMSHLIFCFRTYHNHFENNNTYKRISNQL